MKCEARRGRHSRREGRVHDSTTGNNGNSGHTAATSERFLSDTLADASPPPLAASRHQRAADRAKQENTLLIPLRCYTESSKQGRVSWPTTDFDTSARSNFCNRYIFTSCSCSLSQKLQPARETSPNFYRIVFPLPCLLNNCATRSIKME